jgi:pyrroline-5-carboxylate reductase
MAPVKKILVIGSGNIGGALIGGILTSGVADAEHLTATDTSKDRADELASKYSIKMMVGGNREAAAGADVIIVAVKPTTLPSVLVEIRDVLHEGQILISVAAAFPITLIEEIIGKRMPVFRAMPNIPVVVEEGATGLAANSAASQDQRQFVESVFRAAGVVCNIEEEMMHAVTALSGSGPAYIYMVIEAMIAGGLKMGLSHEVSTRLAEQTVLGAAKLVRETMLHPAILKDRVTTPGGVTISAIHELERHGLRSMLISAVETATKKSRELTQSLIAKFGNDHHAQR